MNSTLLYCAYSLCLLHLLHRTFLAPDFLSPLARPAVWPRFACMHACLSSVSTDRFTRFTACLLHRLAHLPSQSVICSIALCLSTQPPTLQLSQLPSAFSPSTSPAFWPALQVPCPNSVCLPAISSPARFFRTCHYQLWAH